MWSRLLRRLKPYAVVAGIREVVIVSTHPNRRRNAPRESVTRFGFRQVQVQAGMANANRPQFQLVLR